jgi:hypothetical protein
MESTSPDVEQTAQTKVRRLWTPCCYFIYDKSSIFIVSEQLTFIVIFVLFWCDLKEGHPSLVWRVTCPTAYFGLDLYLGKTSHDDTEKSN